MTRTAVQLGINGFGVLGRMPEQDLPTVLDVVRASGLDAVEIMSNVAGRPDLVSALLDRGVTVSAVHLFLDELATPQQTHDWADVLHRLGCQNLILSGAGMDQTVAGYEALAASLVAVVEEFSHRAIVVRYHCHDSELLPLDDASTSGLDVLAGRVPTLRFALDTYWAMAAGLDPAELIGKYRSRSGYYHFKDGDDHGGVEFGTGHLDVSSCLAAADSDPDCWIVLEQDAPASDPASLFAGFAGLVGARAEERLP